MTPPPPHPLWMKIEIIHIYETIKYPSSISFVFIFILNHLLISRWLPRSSHLWVYFLWSPLKLRRTFGGQNRIRNIVTRHNKSSWRANFIEHQLTIIFNSLKYLFIEMHVSYIFDACMCIISYLYPVELFVAKRNLHTHLMCGNTCPFPLFSHIHKPLSLAVVSSIAFAFLYLCS